MSKFCAHIFLIQTTSNYFWSSKSEFLELIVSFFHYFWCQNWDQWQKMSGKTPIYISFYFLFKNK